MQLHPSASILILSVLYRDKYLYLAKSSCSRIKEVLLHAFLRRYYHLTAYYTTFFSFCQYPYKNILLIIKISRRFFIFYRKIHAFWGARPNRDRTDRGNSNVPFPSCRDCSPQVPSRVKEGLLRNRTQGSMQKSNLPRA